MTSAQEKSLISCKNVKFYFTKEIILYNVNWKINKGDFWAVIGPNGGGKSTLARLLVGLLKPTSGVIAISPEVKIGYVPQNTFLNPNFPVTVLDVVMMGFLESNIFDRFRIKSKRQEAMNLLQQLNIDHLYRRKIGELSGGQRQRVLIARALCGGTNVLVLDEPTASVDQSSQQEIYNLLKEIGKEKTIIMISHDISILFGLAKHALYVNKEVLIHDIPSMPKQNTGEHFCEIEMLIEFQQLQKGERNEK